MIQPLFPGALSVRIHVNLNLEVCLPVNLTFNTFFGIMRMMEVDKTHTYGALASWEAFCSTSTVNIRSTPKPWPNPQGCQTTHSCRRKKIKVKELNISLVMAEGLWNTSLRKPYGCQCFDFLARFHLDTSLVALRVLCFYAAQKSPSYSVSV